jgi:3-oxoadipate enol-lactonase
MHGKKSTELNQRHEKYSYYDAGSGLPVVFLHPTPLDHDYWRPLIDNLGGVRAIAPDLRGHGGSDLGDRLPVGLLAPVPDVPALTIETHAADVLMLLDLLKLPRAVFAGCSIGGYILLELWRRAPERIVGMAFICSKPQPDSEAGIAKRIANIHAVRESGTGPFFDGNAQTLIGATARDRRPEIVAELRSRMALTAEAVVATQAGLAVRPNSLPTVPTMSVPMLAIAGGEDVAVSPAEMEALRAAPGGCCEFHLLPDAGHFAAYEQPEKIASLLADWLKPLDAEQ